MRGNNRFWFAKGMRDAIPIALGYLAVSFTLGIAAKNAGFTPFQAFLVSFDVLCIKSETSTRHTDDPASASKL